MVSTRNHPSNFPPPPLESPSKPLTRTSRPSSSPAPVIPPAKGKSKGGSKQTSKHELNGWTHTPSNLTLIWLLISLPLVAWDTGYVLLRPHSMPGGSLHWPLWTPYKLYGEVDYIYGFPALEAGNGFTSAQGVMNIAESLGYVAYLWLVWRFGRATEEVEGRGAPSSNSVDWLGEARSVGGAEAGLAVLIAFTTSALTLSKTVLYWLNEYFSGFANIGQNDALSLMFLWIIPNGLWMVFPAYMIYVFGQELLEALAIASGESASTVSIGKILAIKEE